MMTKGPHGGNGDRAYTKAMINKPITNSVLEAFFIVSYGDSDDPNESESADHDGEGVSNEMSDPKGLDWLAVFATVPCMPDHTSVLLRVWVKNILSSLSILDALRLNICV